MREDHTPGRNSSPLHATESSFNRRRRRFERYGLLACLLFVVLGVLAATLVRITGAVTASGFVVQTGENKAVQHPEGGPVAKVLVQEGDLVQAGDPLIMLDGAAIAAEHRILERREFELRVRLARLRATESEAGEFDYPVPSTLDSHADLQAAGRAVRGERPGGAAQVPLQLARTRLILDRTLNVASRVPGKELSIVPDYAGMGRARAALPLRLSWHPASIPATFEGSPRPADADIEPASMLRRVSLGSSPPRHMGRANVRVAGLAGHAIPSIAASPHPDTAHRPTATIPALADAVLALDHGATLEKRIDPGFAREVIKTQKAVFDSHRRRMQGLRRRLTTRSEGLTLERSALEAQIQTNATQVRLLDEEIAEIAALVDEQLISKSRLTTLKRQRVAVQGEIAALRVSVTRTQSSLNDTRQELEVVNREDFLDLCVTFQGMCHNEPEHLVAVQRMLQ
ncbi:MAG: hypothetical protein KDK91_33230, partial [Gammaproteobacteria bacterium]|nr:hypothetical protein [Gammaproteobacteria bacterium]